MTKKQRKTRLWHFDPSVFQPGRKAGLAVRIKDRTRSIGGRALFLLAFLYPVGIVSVGLFFGGLAFWLSFGGSMGLIGLIIKKAGYASNFANMDVGYRKFIGLVGAFGLAFAFFYGLLYVGIWTLLFIAVGLVAALFVGVQKIAGRT